jgi:predicted negative regulator of RcsB-dependent stress response
VTTSAWIAIVVLILVVGAVIAWRTSTTAKRTRAQKLREEAAQRQPVVEEQEARARQVTERAQSATTEAEKKAAEADRLNAAARAEQQRSDEARAELEKLRHDADRIDPDTDTSTSN